MEGELWKGLYHLVSCQAKLHSHPKGVQYSDALILLVFFWAVLHDRPLSWACQIRNWPAEARWLQVPAGSTMSRRLASLSLITLLTAVLAVLRTAQPSLCRRIDSKPLPVGGLGKDRDARWGYATGGKARGYKLCCAWGLSVVPDAICLGPLNLADSQAAWQVIQQLHGGGYLLADATHDCNPLFQQAGELGFQLLAPRKKPFTHLGHRQHNAWRLRSMQLLEGPGEFGPSLYRSREDIERNYGQLTSFGGGLQPLPSWVRHPRRVVLWVAAKLVINAVRIQRNQALAA
jgi:hypothetical protein